MPVLGSPIWFTLITTMVLGVGIGVLAQPQLVVRFMTAKDSKSLNRAILVGGPFILMMTGVAFTVGALTNVYFMQTEGKLAIDVAGETLTPSFPSSSTPRCRTSLWSYSCLHCSPQPCPRFPLSSMRWGPHLSVTCGAAAVNVRCHSGKPLWRADYDRGKCALAFVMPGSIIARATVMFMGLCASAFLPLFAVGVYCKRPDPLAAKASLIVGAVVWFLWTAFVHVAESKPLGISQMIFGKPSLLGLPWSVIDPLVIALSDLVYRDHRPAVAKPERLRW